MFDENDCSFDIEVYKRECIERGIAPLKIEALANPEETAAYRVAASLPPLRREDDQASLSHTRGQNKKRKVNVEAAKQQSSLQLCADIAVFGKCTFGDQCRKSHDVDKRKAELLETANRTKPEALQHCPWLRRQLPCPHGLNCFAALEHTNSTGLNLMPLKADKKTAKLFDKETGVHTKSDEADKANVILETGASSDGMFQVCSSCDRSTTDSSSSEVKIDEVTNSEVAISDGQSEETAGGETADVSDMTESLVQGGESAVSSCLLAGERVVASHEDLSLDDCVNVGKDLIVKVKAAGLHRRVQRREGGLVLPESKVDVEVKREKLKRLLKGKSILAPLTTVGNLPFRRLCIKLGVDATMSEMILASSINALKQSDLALLKRHKDEKLFGIQIAGGYADQIQRCGEIFEYGEVSCDWIDINMGCPLDGLVKRGAGCALMHREKHLKELLYSLNSVTTKPVSVKMRTACTGSDTNTAHLLMPKMLEWGVSGLSLHGRSAKQRYLREADWDYIAQCSKVINGTCNFTGNGDIFSPQETVKLWEKSQVDSIMIGRGALIKPWIFTELKTGQLWDISSRERFDLLKDFCRYGLEHWGCDGKGIETTRRFLLEEMSFLHRYIPVGLLEVLPQKLNWRGSDLKGRDELETLMARSDVKGWIELSERLLGKAPEDFCFLPKHKSHACEAEG